MAHIITPNYNESGISQSWNRQLYELMPTGFTTDVTLTKLTNTTVQISTFTAYIKDQTLDLGVRIENTANVIDIPISSTENYIVVKLNWVNTTANDFEYDNVAVGAIGANDLVIGMGNFSGSTLVDFDYSLQSKNVLKDDGEECRKVDQLPEVTSLALEDLVLVNDNSSSNDPSYITGDNLYSSIKSNVTYTNDIIDGTLDFWLAGNTSITGVSTATYVTDMMQYYNQVTSAVHDSAQDTNVPQDDNSNNLFNYSLKLTPTTADTSVDASDLVTLVTFIEGYNVLKYIQNGYFTFSFWVYSFKTGTICFYAKNIGNDRTFVKEITINSSNTWEKKIVTIPMDYSGGTWDYTNGVGLKTGLALMGGSTYQTTADSWQSGNYICTSNQDNFCDSTSNIIYFTGFSCGAGTQEIGFDGYDINQALLELNRYYEKSYNIAASPGTVTTANVGFFRLSDTLGAASFIKIIKYKTRKRTSSPTITIYSPATGSSGNVRNTTLGSDQPVSTSGAGETQFTLINNSGTFNDKDTIQYYYTIDARF